MNYDYSKAIEIAEGVYWIGYNVEQGWFRTNPYLIIEGDEAAIIDPGSVIDFDKVYKKLTSVCPIKKLKYVILHHQDPDLCSSTVELEKKTDLFLYMPIRSTLFLKYYGIKSFATPIEKDGQFLEFKTGRKLKFFMALTAMRLELWLHMMRKTKYYLQATFLEHLTESGNFMLT